MRNIIWVASGSSSVSTTLTTNFAISPEADTNRPLHGGETVIRRAGTRNPQCISHGLHVQWGDYANLCVTAEKQLQSKSRHALLLTMGNANMFVNLVHSYLSKFKAGMRSAQTQSYSQSQVLQSEFRRLRQMRRSDSQSLFANSRMLPTCRIGLGDESISKEYWSHIRSGTSFDCCIVHRAKKHFLLLEVCPDKFAHKAQGEFNEVASEPIQDPIQAHVYNEFHQHLQASSLTPAREQPELLNETVNSDLHDSKQQLLPDPILTIEEASEPIYRALYEFFEAPDPRQLSGSHRVVNAFHESAKSHLRLVKNDPVDAPVSLMSSGEEQTSEIESTPQDGYPSWLTHGREFGPSDAAYLQYQLHVTAQKLNLMLKRAS